MRLSKDERALREPRESRAVLPDFRNGLLYDALPLDVVSPDENNGSRLTSPMDEPLLRSERMGESDASAEWEWAIQVLQLRC